MSIFSKLFSSRKETAPCSPWEQTVQSMRDQELDSFDGVQEALYSKDGSQRFVILCGSDGRYRYEYQELTPYGPEELEFFAQMGKTSRAYWSIDCTKSDCPGWPTQEDAKRELQREKAYQKYF